jgi:hypothetical protein
MILKKGFTLALAIIILLVSMSNMLVYISFKVNQSYIAKNLCIEKENENNSCCGSCVLEKKIDELNTTDNNQQKPKYSQHKIDFWFEKGTLNIYYFFQHQKLNSKIIPFESMENYYPIDKPPEKYC